jgi:hypothetical protein
LGQEQNGKDDIQRVVLFHESTGFSYRDAGASARQLRLYIMNKISQTFIVPG